MEVVVFKSLEICPQGGCLLKRSSSRRCLGGYLGVVVFMKVSPGRLSVGVVVFMEVFSGGSLMKWLSSASCPRGVCWRSGFHEKASGEVVCLGGSLQDGICREVVFREVSVGRLSAEVVVFQSFVGGGVCRELSVEVVVFLEVSPASLFCWSGGI